MRSTRSRKMYVKRLFLVHIILAALLCLPGCISTQLNLIRADINEVKQELEKVRQENRELQQDIKELEANLEALEKRIRSGETSIYEATQELSKIREKLGLKAPVVSQPKEREESRESEERLIQPKTAEDFYKLAYEEFRQEKYANATEDFKTFIENFPNSGFVDVAQFWIGECCYAQGDWSNAIREYKKLIKLYPFGSKIPDAYLKLGFSFLEQNNKNKALENFRVVVDLFPHSKAAAEAQENIKQLEKER